MSQKATEILKLKSLRKTPFRIKVLQFFLENGNKAVGGSTLEKRLGQFDRITLYRTLKSFEKQGIIHLAIDGSNETKYALCHADCTTHNHTDNHAHFQCTECGSTSCLEGEFVDTIDVPAAYKIKEVHLAISGVCPECN